MAPVQRRVVSTPGVTPSSIKIGITYPDVAAIATIINVNPGNYQVAYNTLINQINAQGGINGRKITPVYAPVDPLGTAGAATACTKLTEDDQVFAVLGFFQAADIGCYVTGHDTPIVGGYAEQCPGGSSQGAVVQQHHFRQRPHSQGDGGLQAVKARLPPERRSP